MKECLCASLRHGAKRRLSICKLQALKVVVAGMACGEVVGCPKTKTLKNKKNLKRKERKIRRVKREGAKTDQIKNEDQ